MFFSLAAIVFVLAMAGALLWLAPTRTSITIDTAAAAAKADMRLLFGLGPLWSVSAIATSQAPFVTKAFRDGPRIAHALMTPQISDVTLQAVRRIFMMRPRVCSVTLGLNLGDSAQDVVVQTAAQAALAAAPPALRERIVISRCSDPGAEIVARFEFSASPRRLWSIYNPLRRSRAAKEFRRRLRSKVRKTRRAPREVRA